ncbi:hypothetical protein Tco_0705987 [Tanacetum coccineum]|uniref:Integrase, catalytic region, zinc finger, CCHC-type, peptidase aspartic, catalytic n=1 Tax=Tanacetum coccineum TaxID=301880 RepID=A0ABQ4Y737_9ASTR
MSIMSTMDENFIVAGAENRPPMLERSRTLADLTHEEKIRKACDIKATNIIIQGLSLDVYTLLNHHNVAKEIWDIVKLLMEGSEISLQERESKLNIYFDRMCKEDRPRVMGVIWQKVKLLEVGVLMDEEQLAFLADNGEAAISGSPQARAVFMENLTPAGPIYDADTSPSYYSHIL